MDGAGRWTAHPGRRRAGGAQALACATEARHDAPTLVRNAVGPADSRLNRAVYDRGSDWLISLDEPTAVRVSPKGEVAGASPAGDGLSDPPRGRRAGARRPSPSRPRAPRSSSASGRATTRSTAAWPNTVRGPTTCGAPRWRGGRRGTPSCRKVTEEDIQRTADVMHDVLEPFGYQYLQIDDGYEQRAHRHAGRTGCTRTRSSPAASPALERVHRGARGSGPASGPTPASPTAPTSSPTRTSSSPPPTARRPTATGSATSWTPPTPPRSTPSSGRCTTRLRRTGWDYYKLDALRHLRYEGYNATPTTSAKQAGPRGGLPALRADVRDAIGPDAFLLACWGIRPELVGIVDAVRRGHRRLRVRRPRPVQLVQQRRLAQRPGPHRARARPTPTARPLVRRSPGRCSC